MALFKCKMCGGNLEITEGNCVATCEYCGTQQTLPKLDNEKKLAQRLMTVDEKLSETLTKRLDSSFKTVSEQLENVYKSLGEMKELSNGVTANVTSLNRVLTNVKARGPWAEVQLGTILEQTLTAEQYAELIG